MSLLLYLMLVLMFRAVSLSAVLLGSASVRLALGTSGVEGRGQRRRSPAHTHVIHITAAPRRSSFSCWFHPLDLYITKKFLMHYDDWFNLIIVLFFLLFFFSFQSNSIFLMYTNPGYLLFCCCCYCSLKEIQPRFISLIVCINSLIKKINSKKKRLQLRLMTISFMYRNC